MSWKAMFFKVLGTVAMKVLNKIPEAFNGLRAWWKGKTIAIVGPTASGKNSMFNKLQKLPIPDKHVQTRGAEMVSTFKLSWPLPDKSHISFHCKRSVNIGGEVDERERYWSQACKDADVIFYLLDSVKLRDSRTATLERFRDDMSWLVSNFRDLNPAVSVHILLNKIDVTLGPKPYTEASFKSVGKQVEELEEVAKSVLGVYFQRITGVSPISMQDDYLFGKYFAEALSAVAQLGKK